MRGNKIIKKVMSVEVQIAQLKESEYNKDCKLRRRLIARYKILSYFMLDLSPIEYRMAMDGLFNNTGMFLGGEAARRTVM